MVIGLEQFQDETSNEENNLLLLFTDGRPNSDSTVCDKIDLLRDYRQQNVRVIIIGIGEDFIKTEVDCIANNGDIFEIESFTSNDFESIESDLRNILCDCDDN